MQIRHKTFNPTRSWGMPSTLDAICTDMEKDGWQLAQVIPHHQYESVAVFHRSTVIETPSEVTFTKSILGGTPDPRCHCRGCPTLFDCEDCDCVGLPTLKNDFNMLGAHQINTSKYCQKCGVLYNPNSGPEAAICAHIWIEPGQS